VLGCITRQVTSRRIQYSELIPHSLLHSLDLQSHNYCHRQYHNYLSCSHCHSLGTAQLIAAGLHSTRRLLDWNSLRRMQHSNCLTAAHTLSYKPLARQWTTCLVFLLRCHLVYRLPNSSRYTARLSSDVMFTGVARQRCQSCLLFLSNQRASAHFGSTRHGKEKHCGGGGCLPSDVPSTSHYFNIQNTCCNSGFQTVSMSLGWSVRTKTYKGVKN
jgi:hypothetical protein